MTDLNQNPEITSTEEKAASIAAIVSESAKQNEKTNFKSPRGKPPKRGAGRPRKGGAPNKATLARMGLEADPLATPPPVEAGTPPVSGDPLPPPAEGLDLPPAMLMPVLKLPFSILRANTGFDGFNLPDDVAAECMPLLQHVLKQYLPATESEHAPAFMLCATLGGYLFNQFMEFQAWKHEKRSHQREPTKKPEPTGTFPVEHIGGQS